MAIINEMVKVISDATDWPLATATVYARALREAGMLSQAGRGKAAATARPSDAAAMIIGYLSCPVAARAPEYVRDFGGLLNTGRVSNFDVILGSSTIISMRDFHAALTELIAQLASPTLALKQFGDRNALLNRAFDVKSAISNRLRVAVEIGKQPKATILAFDAPLSFEASPPLGGIKLGHVPSGGEGLGPEITPLSAEESNGLASKYRRRGGGSSVWLDGGALCEIAACVNGVDFFDLLKKGQAMSINSPVSSAKARRQEET